MPIIANSDLPSFRRIQNEGELVLTKSQAIRQDIRGLNIGLLNMMPDAALEATERQFFRLIGGYQIVQLYLFPFTLPTITRGEKAQHHIDKYYKTFKQIKAIGLDGLIITGANVTGEDLSGQVFFQELSEVILWAQQNVASTLCSCLATHAVMEILFGQKRGRMPEKYWGVFHHSVVDNTHPLISGVNSDFNVPHSRYNDITKNQFNAARVKILVESALGVHMAVSPDMLKIIFFQGHPEYDSVSLLKEYKREIAVFITSNAKYPTFPQHYLSKQAEAILLEFKDRLLNKECDINDFPEKLLTPMITNSWMTDTKIITANWIGLVYQTANIDVHKQFMDGLDSNNPLELLN